jgi:hypothetical protein
MITNIFSRVKFTSLPENELSQVMQALHIRTPPFVITKMVSSFLQLKGKNSNLGQSNVALDNTKNQTVSTKDYMHGLTQKFHRYGRDLSHRELFKWCQRVDELCHFARGRNDEQKFLTTADRVNILQEAHDVFCAPFPWPGVRSEICRALARLWDLTEGEGDDIALNADPAVVNASYASKITIGRVDLQKNYLIYATNKA